MEKESNETKIVFMGTPEFAVPVLLHLAKNGYNLVGVITQPDRPSGRQMINTPPPIKLEAEKLNLPIYQFAKLDAAAIAKIAKLEPDLIIVAAYGNFLPKKLLELPKHGCLNLHPSLLPKYRGASPVATAILNGETKTGVSIILLDEEMDHGPIVAQTETEILEDDDGASLLYSLACEGADLLIKILPDHLAGKIMPQAQDDNEATLTKMFDKADGEIDWQKPPREINSKVRALYPWPGAWTDITGKRVKILKTHLEGEELFIDFVKPEGKEKMRYDEYLNGNEPLYQPET